MNNLQEDVYKKVLALAKEVKENLKKQGIAVPVENADGTIQMGKFSIIRNSDGFYSIVNQHKEIVADNINMPQTAVIIANDLAIGKSLNQSLLETDKEYGFAFFEEALYKKIINQKSTNRKITFDHYDLLETKFLISKSKKEDRRRSIVSRFEKLRRLA